MPTFTNIHVEIGGLANVRWNISNICRACQGFNQSMLWNEIMRVVRQVSWNEKNGRTIANLLIMNTVISSIARALLVDCKGNLSKFVTRNQDWLNFPLYHRNVIYFLQKIFFNIIISYLLEKYSCAVDSVIVFQR